MPNRIIRESARTSDTLDQLSDGAERMFWRLTTVADDFGRFEADVRVLLSACFPLRVGRLKLEQVDKWLREMILVELIQRYDSGGKKYGFFTTWNKHQRIRAQHSKYPAPSDDNICRQPLPDSPVVVFEKREARSEESDVEGSPDGSPAGANTNGSKPVFRTPHFVTDALDRCPKLGKIPRLRVPAFWQAQLRANPGVELGDEVLKAEAWLTAHPDRPHKDLARFIHNWLARADRPT